MRAFRQSLALVLMFAPFAAQAASKSDNRVAAGRLIVERPTLVSLGFELMVTGDANRNATVKVEYRKAGTQDWLPALPLMRLKDQPGGDAGGARGGGTGGDNQLDPYYLPNAFAGSVFNVQPGTPYEARFTLNDPDGVRGRKIVTASVTTRSEPMPAPGGHVYHVYPPGYKGTKLQPAYDSLLSAYYMGQRNADYYDAFRVRVQPGDTILLHGGLYKDEHNKYGLYVNNHGALGVEFDGTYYLTASGTADKPIVIKGAGDGEVIFDGAGAAVLFDVTAANYNYFEGITVKNAEVGFLVGRKNIIGSNGFTLKHSKIEDVGRGVHSDWNHAKDFYIADNVFIGRHDPKTLMGWNVGTPFEHLPGFPNLISGPGGSEYAVKVYGQGHVVAYNAVIGFHDGIDNATYGAPDGSPDHVVEENLPSSVDFYGNDVFNTDDNCFEGDGGARNIRIFANRCFNSRGAISVTPTFGGPFYVVRNFIYNSTGPVVGGEGGQIVYQNTMVGTLRAGPKTPNIYYRNNLLVGIAGGALIGVQTDETSSSDYNGLMPAPGQQIYWVSDVTKENGRSGGDDEGGGGGRGSVKGYDSVATYSAATSQDKHSIAISYDDFIKAAGTTPKDVTHVYQVGDYDFQLKEGSKAIDAGTVLPTITDGFNGKAPDMGAFEFGQPMPHYGPRP